MIQGAKYTLYYGFAPSTGWNIVIPAVQWSRQSVISCILLALLCTIAAAILWIHEHNRNTAFSGYSLPEPVQPVLDTLDSVPGFLLPPGFELFSNREQYNAENLYEKINGKAPLYLQAGFVRLTTQRFRSGKDPALWFEVAVYDMGTPRNAFSVYSAQKRSGTSVVPSLEPFDHYKTENGLYLRHGPWYVECVGSAVSTRLDEGMIAIARDLFSADAGKDDAVAELQLFPVKDLVPAGFKLILKNAFGSDMLAGTFIARYRLNGQLITAFICPQDSPELAQQVAEKYHQFLLESGGVPEESVDAMQPVDLYGLVEIVFAAGPYVAGIHEGESHAEALEIAGRLKDALTQ